MIEVHELSGYTWVEAINPSENELDDITGKYQLPKKFKNYMLDRHEQPRSAYDELSAFGVLVIRGIATSMDSKAATVPIFLGFSDNVLISVCHDARQAQLLKDQAQFDYSELSEHILAILMAILTPYFDKLDEISQRAEKLEGVRGRKISNKNLDSLAMMKTTLVYLRSATAGNLIAIQELQGTFHEKLTLSVALTKRTDQEISDLLIEYKQCQTMFDVVGDVVSETESAFGNILNNKLNQTMQFLTVWSLILAIPPIVSGFYGMNVKLPFADRSEAWFYTLVITLLLVVWMFLHIRFNRRH